MPSSGGLIIGVLLAAGAARRFGGNKLLAELGDGRCLAEVACANLMAGVDRVVAVIRPGADELRQRLTAAGAAVYEFAGADDGIGASLAFGIRQTPAAGWLIALADMPFVAQADVCRVADALRAGAGIVVPRTPEGNGHPVGFAARYGEELAALQGDQGARAVIQRHQDAVLYLSIANPDCRVDIDTPEDLARAQDRLANSR
jgi:molybdenum cofactor cytidylyltransferase